MNGVLINREYSVNAVLFFNNFSNYALLVYWNRTSPLDKLPVFVRDGSAVSQQVKHPGQP